jgi:hypothetical protein
MGAAGIEFLDLKYHAHNLDKIYNLQVFCEHLVEMLGAALTLKYKPLNMDALPLYIELMLAFPPIL